MSNDQKTLRSDAAPSRPDLPMVIVSRAPHDIAVLEPGPIRRVFNVARFIPVVMAIVMFGGVVGLYFQPPGLKKVMAWLNLQPGGGTTTPIAVPAPKPSPAPDPATTRVVVGLAKLLPEGDVVTIAPPFGSGDARLASLAVNEGDQVERGAILAVLDNERPFLAAIDSATATVAAREASLEQSRASVRASRSEAEAALARAEATAANALREFERSEQLRRTGMTTDSAFEQRRTVRGETAREVERLKATLSRFSGNPEMQPDVIVAARTLASSKADLERARADLEKAYVRAPMAATVLSIHARPGERPGTGGIMNIGDIGRMRADVEVYQTQIGQIAVGDACEISAQALGRMLNGKVSRIGLEVGKQTLVDASPAANTDARVVKVTVTLDAESARVASRFVNLQVLARIAVGRLP